MGRSVKEDYELIKEISRIKKILSSLPADSIKVFGYIWDNISVGEIIFERDLRKIYGIENPRELIQKLQETGLIERGEGCFNLSKDLRLLKKRIGSSYELFKLMNKV